jgi:hypothetical protein
VGGLWIPLLVIATQKKGGCRRDGRRRGGRRSTIILTPLDAFCAHAILHISGWPR